MARSYSLTHQGVTTIARNSERLWNLVQNEQPEQVSIPRQSSKNYIAKTDSSTPIPAMDGVDPGVGTVGLYRLRHSDGLLVPVNHDVIAYNMAGEIPADTFIQIKRDAYGVFWVNTETASAETSYKGIIFQLNGALTTSDASASALILQEFGAGQSRSGNVTVNNLPESGLQHVFEGLTGAQGIALWDTNTEYQIIQMECP